MRASRLWLLVTIVCVALLASGLSAVAVTRPDKKGHAAALPALAAEPFVVTLSAALRTGATPVGQSVVLGSQALGLRKTVVALELWDGGRLVERRAAPARPAASFHWTPLTSGPHLLHARGISSDGQTARSAPVAVDVLAPRLRVPPIPVTAAKGETGAGLAARLGVAPSRVVVRTPRGDVPLSNPALPLPVGAIPMVEITKKAQPTSPLTMAEVVPDTVPQGSGTPLGSPSTPGALPLPTLAGPTVTLVTQGCDVSVKVTGTGGSSATLESATAGAPGFVRGAGRDGDGSLNLKDLLPGVHLWDVRTRDGVSSPVSATVPDRCAKVAWKGDASLVQGILTSPKPSEQLYLYLGVDDKPFVRVPKSDGEFLSSPTRRLDVSSFLPSLDGRRLVLEAWHRVGNDPVRLGVGTLEVPDATALSDVVGEPSAVDLTIDTPQGPARSVSPERDGPLTLHWTAASPRVRGVLFQVLAVPLTPSNTDVSPFGLVSAGFSNTPGSGSFVVDTTALPRYGPGGAQQPAQGGKPATAVAVSLSPPDLSGHTVSLPRTLPMVKDLASSPEVVSDLDKLAPAVEGRIWIRVLPLIHVDGQLFNTPVGIASSTVVVDLPESGPKKPIAFTVHSVQLEVGGIANPALRSCLRVTKTPWPGPEKVLFGDQSLITSPEYQAKVAEDAKYGLTGANSTARVFWPTPGTYCAADYAPQPCDDLFCYIEEGVEAFVDVVGSAWDLVAAAYNGLIDLAATLVATFNPICGALKIAQEAAGGGAGDACIAVGKVVAKAAIAVVLAAYGLPPSLPTSGDLAAIASGNLAVLAVELLKQLGVPCDDLTLDGGESAAVIKAGDAAGVDVPNVGGSVDACLVTATLVLNKVKGEAKKLVQQTVASNTGWPAYDVPGLEYIPEPNGHLQPTRVHVYAVPKQPVTLKDLFTRPPCVIGTGVTTKSGLPAPFLDGSTALHPVPTAPAVTGPLAGVAASVDAVAQASGIVPPANAWEASFFLSTPSSPNLDVDSVYQGLTLKATVSSGSGCLPTSPVVSDSYGPPRGRYPD